MKGKIEPDRAKAIGRTLFQKYDLGRRGNLGPKQCYEVFSDYVYRILSFHPAPTMQEAGSMFDLLDENKDKAVTESDFENLAVRYLCSTGLVSNFATSNVTSQSSQVYSNKQLNLQNQSSNLFTSNVTRFGQSRQTSIPTVTTTITTTSVSKVLTSVARKRLDVARRLFKMFDKDGSGFLTEEEIPSIIQETYKEMGQNYQPSREDVKSYMKMVDSDKDGRISLPEFEEIILRSLKNAGIEIYE